MTADPNELLLAPEVAVILRTPVKTLAYWRSQGIGPEWIPLGKRITYQRSAVEAYIAQQAERARAAAQRRRAS